MGQGDLGSVMPISAGLLSLGMLFLAGCVTSNTKEPVFRRGFELLSEEPVTSDSGLLPFHLRLFAPLIEPSVGSLVSTVLLWGSQGKHRGLHFSTCVWLEENLLGEIVAFFTAR